MDAFGGGQGACEQGASGLHAMLAAFILQRLAKYIPQGQAERPGSAVASVAGGGQRVHLFTQGTTKELERALSDVRPLGCDVSSGHSVQCALVVCASLCVLPLLLQGCMEALPLSLIAHTADGSRHTVTPPPAHILPASSINSALVRTHQHDPQL